MAAPSFHRHVRLPAALTLLASLLAANSAAAKLEQYQLDPVHTRVLFQVSHAGFSNAPGSFSGSTGTLEFDPDDWTTARLAVRIPVTTLDMGDAEWRENVLDRSFFNSGKYPEARFVSTAVEPVDERHARVTGDLTMHGVTRPVVLEVTLNAIGRHPMTKRHMVGFSATATLDRREFGMDKWQAMVGNEVRLQIEAEAMRR